MGVTRLDDRILGNDRPGPVTERLHDAYWRFRREGWCARADRLRAAPRRRSSGGDGRSGGAAAADRVGRGRGAGGCASRSAAGCARAPSPTRPRSAGEGENWRNTTPARTTAAERALQCRRRRRDAGRPPRRHCRVRRLRPARHRQQPGVRGGRSVRLIAAGRRPARSRRGPFGYAVRRRRWRLSGPDACGNRPAARPAHADAADPLAAARRPAAEPGGARPLPALPASPHSAASRRAGCC